MTQQQSLADQAVAALAAISAMDADVTINDAERHIIWGLKRSAVAALESGIRVAHDLAWQAHSVREGFKEIAPSSPSAPDGGKG